MPDQCRSVLSSILNIDKDALLNQLPLTPLQIALLTGNIEMALHILTLAPHTCGIDLLVSEPESESTLRNEYSLNCLHLAVLSGQISTLSRFLRCVKSFDDHDFTTPAKISTSMTSSITRDIAGTKVTTNFPLGRKLLFGRTSNYEYGYTPLSLAVKCNLPIISRELMRFERFYKIL